MPNNKTLLNRIEQLEARNKRVEADKAWETSWTRRLLIMVLTYLVVISYLHFVVHINPWINGFVPVIGYFFSTLTVGVVKKYWLSKR
jgi:hypothetical protein